MRRPTRALPLVATFGLLLLACDPAWREVPQYTIEDFMSTTSYGGASFSPDNSKILVSHDGTGIFNAYAIPVAGGDPVALTNSTDNAIIAISYFRNDERFLYTADQGGNELNHVYVQTPDGGVTDLTPGTNVKASFAGWAGDDQSFFIQSNERDPRYFDVYRYQVADGHPREMIFQNDEGFTPQISPMTANTWR